MGLNSDKSLKKAVQRKRSILARWNGTAEEDDEINNDDDDDCVFFADARQTRCDAFRNAHHALVSTVRGLWDSETQASANSSDVCKRHVNCTRVMYCKAVECGRLKAECQCAAASADGKFHGRILCVCERCKKPAAADNAKEGEAGTPRQCSCSTPTFTCETHAEHTQLRDNAAMYEIFKLKHPEIAEVSTRISDYIKP